jgi:hypothetical protein
MGIIKEIPMRTIPKSRTAFSVDDLTSIDDIISNQIKPTNPPAQLQQVQKSQPRSYDPAEEVVENNQQVLSDKQYLLNERVIAEVLLKSLSGDPVQDAYDNLNKDLRHDDTYAIEEFEQYRRAIVPYSTAWNSLGIFRSDFNKLDNDKMCRNAYVAIIEKAFLDYFGSIDWDIIDKDTGDREDRAFDFMCQPNPQDSFADVIIPATQNLFRYDAGAIVKTFNRKKELVELKAYPGTEFWFEIDRVPQIISVPTNDNIGIRATDYVSSKQAGQEILMQGWWSRGLTWRYWQRSQTGVYIPFTPSEVCYLCKYKRTDSPYGTDYLKFLKYQVQYLIDSTVAAGRTFQNGLIPSMAITHPQVHAIEQIQQRIMQLRVDNTGPARVGAALHLINGESAQTFAQTIHDMEWVEGQKYIAQIIWGFFGFTPDEFTGGDTNRASAYVKRNITKSRLLYPMMRYFEDKINREILPHLKGYKKSWRFHFIRELELDDKQKMAQTGAIRTNSLLNALDRGVPERIAIKLANDDLLNKYDVEELIRGRKEFKDAQMVEEMGGMAPGDSPDGGMEDAGIDQGRYGNGSDQYQPMNFGDYGQGGENTEQRMGNAEEKEYQKADPMNYDVCALAKGMTFRKDGKKYEVTFANEKIVKARVYVSALSDVPEGRQYKQGSRGGFSYLTTMKQNAPSTKKRKKGGSGGGEADEEGGDEGHSAPSAPDLKGAEGQVKVIGNGVGIVAGIVNGKLEVRKLSNPETDAFVKKVVACGDHDTKKFLSCMTEIAKKEGLKVSS